MTQQFLFSIQPETITEIHKTTYQHYISNTKKAKVLLSSSRRLTLLLHVHYIICFIIRQMYTFQIRYVRAFTALCVISNFTLDTISNSRSRVLERSKSGVQCVLLRKFRKFQPY